MCFRILQVNTKQSFEIGFNKACALLDLGDFAAAETELRMALKTGREALFEEDCAEEEVEQELAPVTVQLGYALGRQGRAQEAVEIYEQVGGGLSKMGYVCYGKTIPPGFTESNAGLCINLKAISF